LAEEVTITNVGGDGVASEVTMQNLLKAVQKMARANGVDPEKTKEKFKELNEELQNNLDIIEDTTESYENVKEAIDNAAESSNKFARTIAGGVLGAFGQLYEGVIGFGQTLLG